MISPENLTYFIIGYFAFVGLGNITLSIAQAEKSKRTHYGIPEGLIGILVLGIAVYMLVI